jgi:hypothetical protein
LGQSADGERDIYAACKVKRSLGWSDFWSQYKRIGYARAVNLVARSCWRDGASLFEGPLIVDGERQDPKPVMEEEMKKLRKQGIYRGLEKADTLNRIGSFSILFVGVPGGKANEPVQNENGRIEDVYFSAYSQQSVTINKYDDNPESPRYGLPVEYTITPGKQVNNQSGCTSTTTDTRKTFNAHWTRVVHLAEGALDNEIEGLSALEPIYDALNNLQKTSFSASESFWRNCMTKFVTLYENDGKKLTDTQKDTLDTAAKAFANEQQQFYNVKGAKDVKFSDTNVPDPQSSVDTLLKEISAATGIPIRILTGEGAGQLAGNEDKASFNQLISDRQQQWCNLWLSSTLDILTAAGVIGEVPEDTFFHWPAPKAMDEETESKVRLNNANADLAEKQAEMLDTATGAAEGVQDSE